MPADNKYTFHILGSDKTKAAFASLNASMRRAVNTAGTMGAGFAAGLAVMVSRSIEANTEMTRLGHSVGVGSKVMSEWSHAAKTVNVEGDKMADIFKDVQDKIGDFAATGGGGAADMFAKLNLNVKEFVGLSPDEQLVKIGEALDGVQSRSEKIFFLESLASDASRLLPLLENNAEGLKELQAEASQVGVSISEVDAAKLEMARRSMERIQAQTSGFANKVAIEVAPIVESLASRLFDAAGEGDRMGRVVSKAFSVGGKAVAVFADGLHGVKIVFKGLELVATGFGAVIASVFELAVKGIFKLASEINQAINVAIEGLNRLPKVDIPLLETDVDSVAAVRFVDTLGNAMRDKTTEVRSELHKLLMQDLPSRAIKESVDAILEEADARANQKAAEIRTRLAQGTGAPAADSVDNPLEEERARLAAKVALIGEFQSTELQQLREKKLEEQLILEEALEKKAITEEEYQHRLLKLDQVYSSRRRSLEAKEQQARYNMAAGFLANTATAFVGSQKKLFKVQKAVSLAKALVSLPSAVVQSYENAGGYPLGIPAAIAMAAKGAAEIASIKKTEVGSGVSSSGGGGGGGALAGVQSAGRTALATPGLGNQFAPQNTPASPQTIVHFNVSGDIIGDTAETMLTQMRTLIEDSDAVLFGPNSRQAMELAGA